MNIRQKSSPVQSNIRAIPTGTRGQTPPPPSQLRHFEDASLYPSHFQAPGASYQPSQSAYVDMNKPAPGRVGGPGLPQGHQGGYSMPRPQHNYNLMADSQDQQAQQMWNPQQGSYYIPQNQNMRPQRMQATINNGQVAFMPGMASNMANMAFIPSNMAASYSGNQGMPFVQNPGNQFMQYQPRMPFPTPMPQQQQMSFMPQYGPTSTAYAAPPTYYHHQPPMAMPSTSRPSSAGPQGAMGGGPKSRSRKMLSLTDPTTGEDITEKVFKPMSGEELDPSMLESQAHREAVHLEFATKVAFLAKDKKEEQQTPHIPIQITAPPPQPSVHHAVVMEEISAAPPNVQEQPQHAVPAVPMEQPMPVMNGEPETNIPEQDVSTQPPASYSTSAKEFEPSPLSQSVETVAAGPEVQTPSPAQPSAPPVMPMVADMAASVEVAPQNKDPSPPPRVDMVPPSVVETAPVPVVEKSPSPIVETPAPAAVVEKEPTPPVESAAMVPPSMAAPMQSTSVSAADAAKVITEMTQPSAGRETSPPATAQASAPQSQAQPTQAPQPQPQPQPQRDGKKSSRKHRRDLNKKSKEGSDMDAFYDPQPEAPKQETVSVPAPREPSPKATPPASISPPPPSTSPAPVVEVPQEAAASAVPQVEVTEPVASAPETEVAQPPPEVSPEPEVTVTSAVPESAATPPVEVVDEPAPEVPLPTPKDEEQEAAEEVAAPEAAEVEAEKQNGEVAETDLMDIHTRLVNGLGLNYKEGQWSPLNPEGKKQYDREFLLKLQANPESRKAPDLPHMPEIIVDPRLVRMEDFQRAQMAASRSVPDFTPGFFKSYTRSGPSLTKRNSQQRGRGGPGSQSGEQQQQRIIISTRQEVQLHKSENAYKPQFQAEADLPVDEKELKDLQRKFQSILNKLTPEKFAKLVVQALEMKIDTEERLTAATNLIFEKAIAEQKFAAVYADFCRELLKLPKVMSTDKEREVTFRGVLLTKCQKEFEKDKATENALENKKKELESALASNAPQEQTNRLKEELEMETKKARYRSMGNIRFIGELFRLKMLTENIMHDCIFKLLKTRDDDSMECLTKLLDTVGADLDHTKAKVRMDQYFVQFDKMTADMRGPQGELSRDAKPSQTGGAGSQSSKKDGAKLSSRVKFGILDIIDLRKNNWVKRRIHDQNRPTTLGAIHQKAKEEEQAAQFLNSQPRQEPSAARGGARPKGRGSAQGDMDGWNTVPPRQVKQQIEPTRMKLTKTNVDVNNLTLGGGNKFQNWGRGSQGGGSRSQEQEKMANRYTALNNLADNDSRRGYGRSPARGDARGSGRMDRDLDRRDRDRDRDYRKPVARSSMEERERAVASTRNMLGAVGGSSNPSSRNASRDNSRSRDTPPEGAAKKVAAGLDVKKMSETELNRRIDTITEEFINNQAFQETLESIAELENLDHSMLIMTMLEKLVERTGSVRRLYGQFLFHMVRERQLSVNDLLKGLEEFLQVAEDLELDVPKIWDYLAEVMAGLVGDNKVVPLDRFLKECMRPLVAQGRKKEVYLVTRILKQAADYKSKDIVQTQWGAAGLKLTDFGLSETELSWLKGQSRIYEEIYTRLQRGDSDDEIAHWIDRCIKSEEKESNQFVRELFSAICRNSIVPSGEKKQVNVASLKNHVMLVRKFVDTQEKGTQALFGVQHLMNELQHPPGVVRTLFEQFYDEDMISEESFFDWESREDAPEDKVGKGVVKMNLRSFFEWLRSSNEDERTS